MTLQCNAMLKCDFQLTLLLLFELIGYAFEVLDNAGLLDKLALWVTPHGNITGERRHC